MDSLKKISPPFVVVGCGQRLRDIAEYFCVPALALVALNRLKEDVRAGDVLFLPQGRGEIYTARVGETMQSICRNANAKLQEVIECNGVDFVWAGARLWIPRGSNK